MKEQLSKIIKNPAAMSAIVGTVTFGAGTGLGYILGRRKNSYEVFEPPPRSGLVLDAEDLDEIQKNNHFAEVEDDESEENEESDAEEDEEGEDEDLDDLNAEAASRTNHSVARDFIAEKLREPVIIEEEEPEVVADNIFAGNSDEWDLAEETAKRTPSAPYVLHKDEFFADERGFHQTSIVWYAGDQMMADQQGQPIYNHAEIIGPLLFGHGSGDRHVFYVRNEKLRGEYEVFFDSGRFEVEVMGMSIEQDAEAEDVKHSNSPRRFQMD
jgi:hypothetical protein